jgi:dienelactone hydrolase
VPEDTLQRGPWPVGERTVAIGRLATVEVFYPAQPGSEAGKDVIKVDLRAFLPKSEQKKVPDAEATIVSADTYRDLPIDPDHGPYPVVIFVHGTASFRFGSFTTQALWASRGFIVVAADHPALCLADYVASSCGTIAPAQDLSGDVDAELKAVTAATGDLAFLAGHVDAQRVGLGGHSAGAVAAAQFSTKPGVQVVMALAGTRAVSRSSTLKSVLFAAGTSDEVLSYGPGGYKTGNILYPGSDTDAYNASPGKPVKKRLIGITKGGHLNVSDLCHVNAQNQSDLQVAEAHGVCGMASVVPLADCGSIAPAKSVEIVNTATTAVLEETLLCKDRSAAISGLKTRFPDIGDFHEE